MEAEDSPALLSDSDEVSEFFPEPELELDAEAELLPPPESPFRP